MVSMVELDNLNGLLSKGRSTAMYPSLLSTTKNEKTIPANLTVLSPQADNKDENMCCIFPGSALELKPKIDTIFREKKLNCLKRNTSEMLLRTPKFVLL